MTHFMIYNLCCPSFMATHMCVCSERYVAVPLNERGNVAVWKTKDPLDKPVVLIGHHKSVTALDLSHSPFDHYLCSCSPDNIILWNLLENDGNPTKGIVIHSHMEQPVFCHFSSDNSRIAFSFPNGMWIFDLKENSWLISIEEYCFTMLHYNITDNKILGIKDIYLKSWDLQSNEVVTTLNITPGFLTALCIDEQTGIIVVGTTSGHLNVYGKNYNMLRNIQIWKLVSQHQKFDTSDESSSKSYNSDSFPIFSIKIFKETEDPESYLPQVIYLLIVTSTCIFVLNINTEDLILYLDFNDSVENTGRDATIGLVRFAATACSSDNSVAYVNVLPVMGESLVLIKLLLKEIIFNGSKLKECVRYKDKLEKSVELEKPCLTFLNSASKTHEKSLLAPKVQCSVKTKNLKKSLSNLNLPVTFHSNVKSSGYGALHKPPVLFQPQIVKSQRIKSDFHLPKKVEKDGSVKEKKFLRQYEGTTNFQNLKLLDKIESFKNPMVTSLQITVDGQYASCTSSEGLVDILKLGKEKVKIIQTLNAHKGEVNSAKWSHSEKLLVSGGKDKTVKIWNFEKQQPLLTTGLHKDSITGITKSKYIFEDSIEQVQFYYLDRFILAAAGNELYLFDYVINIEKSGIKRFVNKSFVKLVKKIPLNVKRITTLAAMNQFFSNLVLCGGSSKCIDVMDMTVGKVLLRMEDVSSRPPYLISLNEGSPYTSHASALYDIFLTASQFDGIKIWDLRSNKYVLCYKEHRCRSFPCGATFSPCGKYIATGSEDKSVYIYDLRQLTHMHKLIDQQIDVFTSVTFTPRSQLLTSSLNGMIYFYGQKD